MAGKMCPKCGALTFFESLTGRKCSKCGYTMTLPQGSGKGGKGQKCSNCNSFRVFNNKCAECGATYK
jgi:ribosomal protein S27AE